MFTFCICPYRNPLYTLFKAGEDGSIIAYYYFTIVGQSLIEKLMKQAVLSEEDKAELQDIGWMAAWCAITFLSTCSLTFLLTSYYDLKNFCSDK